MQGNYQTPPGIDPYTAMFIEQLQMEPVIANSRPINIYFTTEEWKLGWRKIKERTATGSDSGTSGTSRQDATMISSPTLKPLWPISHS
jgi:hypothetical protein